MVDPRVCAPTGNIELADVVRRFGPEYISQYGEWMMPSHKKALSDIAACCTRELGGRLYCCDDCDDTFWSYHCCRNRACPKCHGSQVRLWLNERQAELLPCDFRTAITNARILDMDPTHVTFRWKDRTADAWRTERLPGVEFLRRFLQHVLPRGFHKVRYYGLWHPSKRDQSNRAWVLLILATPADPARPLKITSLSEALSQLMELTDHALNEVPDDDEELPRCPHCGSCRTRLLGAYPRLGGP